MNRTDLHQLAEIRIKDARALFGAGFYDGAYYLAGYSIECALKSCAAKRTKEHDLPEKPEIVRKLYVHKLNELIGSIDPLSTTGSCNSDGSFA